MKFEIIRQQVPILSVARYLMRPGHKPNLFYWPGEQEPSIKVYPSTQSFYDFGRCVGGDCIRLWSHVCRVDNMVAARAIVAAWEIGLGTDSKITAEEIKCRQRAKLEARQAHEQVWRCWRNEVDYLKLREQFYNDLLQSPHVKPFSAPWCCVVNSLQIVRYRLDILCEVE